MMEIYIIELPKVEKYGEEEKLKNLNLWMKFIKKPEVFKMTDEEKKDKELSETVEAIEEAQRNLEELSKNKEAREIVWLREKYRMDKKLIEASGYNKGMKEGIEKGIEQGTENGKKEKQLEIAKKMLKDGMDIELICKYTGVQESELQN